MARFENIFNTEKPQKNSSGQKAMKPMNIHYSKLITSNYQYREFDEESVQKLAELIIADGEILQPLLVRKAGPDSYEIIAGHKRAAAVKYIVETDGLVDFAMIPCYVNNMDDVKAEFAVYSTNGYEEKTPYEQMREIEGMIRLIKENPEKFRNLGKGRLVERLSKVLNVSRATVSEYQNISNNLGREGMAAFEEGRINKSAALELSRMDENDQEDLLERGITSHKDIKKEHEKKKATAVSRKGSDKDLALSVVEVMELLAVRKTGICPHCGKEIYAEFHACYCGSCGGSISWESK